jgi:hypothetical protein
MISSDVLFVRRQSVKPTPSQCTISCQAQSRQNRRRSGPHLNSTLHRSVVNVVAKGRTGCAVSLMLSTWCGLNRENLISERRLYGVVGGLLRDVGCIIKPISMRSQKESNCFSFDD